MCSRSRRRSTIEGQMILDGSDPGGRFQTRAALGSKAKSDYPIRVMLLDHFGAILSASDSLLSRECGLLN